MINKITTYFIFIISIVTLCLSGCDSVSENSITSVSNSSSYDESETALGDTKNDNSDGRGTTIDESIYDSVFYDSKGISAQPFTVLNNNIPLFSDAEKSKMESFENYSPLDSFGRCGVAFACIGTDIMPTQKRESISSVKPSGWHSVKYDFVDGGSLYNRCHLIGFQLAGENANEKNLITGTRYLNVTGMLPFENMVADYVKETDNHVLYRVTPNFEKNNLVASGIQIEAWSVEDDGDGICFNVFCPNVQPGIIIDYATGESSQDNNYSSNPSSFSSLKENSNSSQDSKSDIDDNNFSYVLNLGTKKFHLPSCSSVKSISEKNKSDFYGNRDSLINEGYTPCGNCKP